ncbi:amidohydrolase family protein [Actinomyces sp. zg-332]|uniref:amidohydrolase family protein n=1 Tax=Actinomyces sp. zg-332 TaxID=2708340 RepID=UPI0014234A63|nr:amidohydrolase family protein [Actinomyces sp. zg-332]QPK93768.1 amidohydrolase family protein [Actinomyces sp. zg-332]
MRNWYLHGSVITPSGDKKEVWVNNGLISYTPKTGTSYKEFEGFIFPGLVDMHCHLGMSEKGATSIATAQKQAQINMDSGVLAIRDGGSRLNNEWFKTRTDMPVVFTAGNHIAKTKRYIKDFAVELENESDLVKEVVYQAYRTNHWVKIVADWIDRSDGAFSDIKPLWSKSVLKEAITAAHEMGVRVMAHSFGTQAAEDLIECGVDTIEHGNGLRKEHMQECAIEKIPVIPTMLQRENFLDFAKKAHGKYPLYEKTMAEYYENRYSQLIQMYEEKVLLLPGSDAGGSISHGLISDELALWVKAGIPTKEVINFAVFEARKFLGISTLEDYSGADLVIYSRDPREDISVLKSPELVLLRGKKV